ncbi:MAG: ABC transporter ATP-binding protein [Bdellovibrio sp.]|nr:ABC transporter ATP-binding protein [Bdellovibrio sp.]
MNQAKQPILEVRRLTKKYKEALAVAGIDFSIQSGSCFGLLGPNGAGKTTTIEMIEGLTPPTGGEIFFQGRPVDSRFRDHCGIQFQATALQDYLTVREVLDLFGNLYRRRAPIESLISLCGLSEFCDQDTDRISGGQRQRLLLAVALVNNPDIIFLDEPTTGLDPHARRNFWELIRTIKQQGKTVVLTTHYMEEAYVLCDEIAIMDHGTIIARGAPDQLLKRNFNRVTLEIPKAAFENGSPNDLKIPASLPGEVHLKPDTIEIHTSEVNATLEQLIKEKVSLSNLKIRSLTLEDLFLQLTQKESEK